MQVKVTVLTKMQLDSAQDVIEYWFGDTIHGSLESIQDRMKLWFFRASPEFDAVQSANANLIEQLTLNPQGLGWNIHNDPQALLATIIVLDQFSRSVFRGTARAFVNDEVCADLIATVALTPRSSSANNDMGNENSDFTGSWYLDVYSPIERFFLCVALQHSERLIHQQTGIRIAPLVGYGADESIIQYFANLKGFPMEHYEVIRRFDRFPHRNILLVISQYLSLNATLLVLYFAYVLCFIHSFL